MTISANIYRLKKYHKLVKFMVSGASAAIVEYVTFLFVFMLLGDKGLLIIAQVISFCLGLVTSFVLNKNWVFKKNGDTKRVFLKYVLLAGINLLLSSIVLSLLSLIISPIVAKVIAMIMIATWNYFIFQKIIFR